MSDLTDNERIWLCICLNNGGKYCNGSKMPISAKKKVFSYEAHFDLGGYINKQNIRIWGTENPHAYIEKPTLSKYLTVWCGFWSRVIFGPFLFENEQGEAATVNSDHYRAMLNEFLFTKIEEQDIGNICFQQWGATCHTAEATLNALRPVFEDRIITSQLRYDTVGLLFVECRQPRDNWRFKGQHLWSHW